VTINVYDETSVTVRMNEMKYKFIRNASGC